MRQKTKLLYLLVIVLSLSLGFAMLSAIAKNDNAKKDNASKTSQFQGKEKAKKAKKANLKNYEKADKTTGKTNAQVHKEKTQKVIQNLEQVANQEESDGSAEVSGKIEQIAQVQEQVQEQTAEAIEQVEKRGKIKTFLIGTDYKNLGQLRSSLVHNRNQIRKLTQTMNQVQNEEETSMLQEQLMILMQERERIKAVITENESGFSLFGWVSRFLFNYEQTPINEQEEAQLTEEVEEAIDTETENEETGGTTLPTNETAPENSETMPVQ